MNKLLKRLLIAAAVLASSASARADIAVVVHPDHPLASMTVEQLADIYLGNDSRFLPVDLPESQSLRHWFYYKVTGRDALQIRIRRARQFDRVLWPKVVRSSADAVRRVAGNKRAIAYVDESAVDASVKVVMTIQNSEALEQLSAED